MDLFVMGERKTKKGDITVHDKLAVKPRFAKELPPELVILVKENQEFKHFQEQLSTKLIQLEAPAKNPQADVLQLKKPEVQSGS
jgi:hypothetical protein